MNLGNKTYIIHVRITPKMREYLDGLSKQYNITLSQVVTSILNHSMGDNINEHEKRDQHD